MPITSFDKIEAFDDALQDNFESHGLFLLWISNEKIVIIIRKLERLR